MPGAGRERLRQWMTERATLLCGFAQRLLPRKLRLTSRMRAGFAAMSALLLVGGLVTVVYTYRMQTATAQLLAQSVMNLKAAESVEVAVERLRDATAKDFLTNHADRQALEVCRSDFRKTLLQAEEASGAPPDVLRELSKCFTEYEQCLIYGFTLAWSGRLEQARPLAERAGAISRDMYVRCEGIEDANEMRMYADLARIRGSNQVLRLTMYVLGASGILLGYFLGLAISRSITKPIYELVLKLRGDCDRELVERVDVRRGREFEDLDEHVRHLIERANAARADLEKSRRLLERSERLAALGRISAGVAHEIRNPLTSIKMLVHAIRESRTLPETQSKDLAVVVDEIDRMDRFVESFLRFARPPGPKLVPVDPNRIVHETLDLLAPRLRQGNTLLVERYQSDLGTIAADPDQIRQVIMNLVLNALDAMPDGGTLTLETRRNPPANGDPTGAVQLRVKDSGCGIPAEILENLFDPFLSGREEGMGLGLAISHQIVQQHGGWIDAVNDPGGGVTVTVSLPDQRGQEHAQSPGSGRPGERPIFVPKNAA
jgi:signal transduction histidine kinase